MAGILFSKLSGKNDALFGKIETPVKMFILNESNLWEKRKSLLSALFNVEKSNRFAETTIGETDFGDFQAVGEGQNAENDSIQVGHKKTIEHIAFMKEFTVTREMIDDTVGALSPAIKRKAKNFIAAYYKTQIKIASLALANGTKNSMVFNKATVDLTVGDGKSLFNNSHTFVKDEFKGKTQSNYYYSASMCGSAAELEASLQKLAVAMRNFKDENGDPMGYVADTIIIPGNRAALESAVKKVVGSERTTGSNNNDINTQFGNWTIVVNDYWETNDDRFIIMSSEANEQLGANMFYNRVKLDVTSDIDKHSRNYFMNGYCRFGVGFTGWKHAILAVDADSAVSGATQLA